ncbi:MAG: DUF1501 domain-containing protein [Chthoniobacteraceae bacterium]
MTAHADISHEPDDPRTLVVVFLRGAADGLTLVAPIGDDDYHKLRPRLAVKPTDAVPLDGLFGMHPNLRALETAWKDGDLAIIHGAGGESDTRSHFEAQDLMEHGGVAAGGWLGRFLRARGPARSPLSAVALAPTLPESLSGAPSAAAFQSLGEFAIFGKDEAGSKRDFSRELQRLYARESDALSTAAQSTFEAMRRIEAIDAKAPAAHGAQYDEKDSFATGLRQVAQLIKADLGIDAASVDLNGWDSHFTQQTLIEPLMLRLANGLAAFRQDLGPKRMAHTSVVVMTEFGRRVTENSAFGTDHGRGGAMFVLGGGVKGGRVIGDWPGLKPDRLDGPGDLPVWNNYRNILAPVLARHGATDASLGEIFPDFSLSPIALYF